MLKTVKAFRIRKQSSKHPLHVFPKKGTKVIGPHVISCEKPDLLSKEWIESQKKNMVAAGNYAYRGILKKIRKSKGTKLKKNLHQFRNQ